MLVTANTDVSTCGYVLPAQVSSTSSSATLSATSPAASGTLQNADSGSSTRLTGGQLAGTIVGSIIGGLLVSRLSVHEFTSRPDLSTASLVSKADIA